MITDNIIHNEVAWLCVCSNFISTVCSVPNAFKSTRQKTGYPVTWYPVTWYPITWYPVAWYPVTWYPVAWYPVAWYPVA